MEKPEIQNLGAAGGHAIPLGRVDVVELGGITFDRATFQPGWRWSDHATTDSCEERHLGYLIAGRMGFRMRDGTELEAGAGDAYLIPPGHDAWVVGDEPCVALDLALR